MDHSGGRSFELPKNVEILIAFSRPASTVAKAGIDLAIANGKPVHMLEFSTASCRGLGGVSDTFGTTFWGIDYSPQLASVGYSAAHLHTRERNVTYNLYDYPGDGVNSWTTLPVFYSPLPVLNALQNVQYTIPQGTLPKTGWNITVRYLTAPSIQEKWNITWGGKTWNGAVDGNPVNATNGQPGLSLDCSAGCTINVPNPGLALVLVNTIPSQGEDKNTDGCGRNGRVDKGAIALVSMSIFSVFCPRFLTPSFST